MIFVLYYLGFRALVYDFQKLGSESRTCLERWEDLDQSIGVDSSSVSFIGNGHIGVDVNGELRQPVNHL
ncbi:hypothetical protein OSTOST_23827 [Ostertagia ostertagi]